MTQQAIMGIWLMMIMTIIVFASPDTLPWLRIRETVSTIVAASRTKSLSTN